MIGKFEWTGGLVEWFEKDWWEEEEGQLCVKGVEVCKDGVG